MTETPNTPNDSQLQTSQPDVPVDGSGTTGNLADAAPTQSNPTDSSSVSDEQGVQAERLDEADAFPQTPPVDHEGSGPGDKPAPATDLEGAQEDQ
jgi:hypothetical protein